MVLETNFPTPVKIFLSYARQDTRFKEQLYNHLNPMTRNGLIEIWDDQKISAGSHVEEETALQIDSSDIVICLLSPDLINSEYCFTFQMDRALARRELHLLEVIPILLRPVDWQKTPFSPLQTLPRNGRAILERSINRDKMWRDIVKEIEKTINVVSKKLANK